MKAHLAGADITREPSTPAFGRIASLVLVAMLMLGAAAGARAVTLQDLFDGATLIAGGQIYSDWQLDFVDSSGPAPDFNLIDVVPLEGDPLNPGIEYRVNGQLTATGLDVVELAFAFRVETLSGLSDIIGNSLSLEAFETQIGGGVITIFEDVLSDSFLLLGEKSVEADEFFGVFALEDFVDFDPQGELLVDVFLTVEGDDFPGRVSLDRFSQRFSVIPPVEVPEPGTLLLLLVASTLLVRKGGYRFADGNARFQRAGTCAAMDARTRRFNL